MSLASYPSHRLELSDMLPRSGVSRTSQPSTTQWQQYFSKSSNDLIAHYASASSSWPDDISLSSRLHGIGAGSRQLASTISANGHYPEPSQRTVISSSATSTHHPSTSTPLTMTTTHSQTERRKHSESAIDRTDSWGNELYTIDHRESLGGPSRTSNSTPSVKMEPDDSGDYFINEYSSVSNSQLTHENSLAPPTEVPLRATQASKEMRKMMGVFRLNPFTMHHDGGRGISSPTWNGEEVGPLDEEPRLFEYQLGCDIIEIDPTEELRSFSPDFEIDNSNEADGFTSSNDWDEYDKSVSSQTSTKQPSLWDQSSREGYTSPTGTAASLEFDCPEADSDNQQAPSSYHYSLNGYHAAQHNISVPPSPIFASSPSSVDITHLQCRNSPSESSWGVTDHTATSQATNCSIDASEQDAYSIVPTHSMASGPGPTPYVHPSGGFSTSAARRWSLPANTQAPFLL